MKFTITSLVAMTLLAGTAVQVQAAERPYSNSLRVDTPENNPELAQKNPEAFYLHLAGDGRTLLYVEKQDGSGLAVLDVTNPARIHRIAETELTGTSAFDFVQNIGDNAVLIRYRNGSGVALLDFKRVQRPALVAASALEEASSFEPLGETGLLVTFAEHPSQAAGDLQTYRVIDTASAAVPRMLATVEDVRQRAANDETGTLFLLNSDGVTAVRRLRVEQEHQAELVRERGN
jgi:hypothetical protein